MFKDKNEELRRLEALLQEEEANDQLFTEEDPNPQEPDPSFQEDSGDQIDEIDRFYLEQTQVFSAYNADMTEVRPDELSEELLKDNTAHLSPLVAICCGLATAVLIMVLYLILRYGGFL